MFTHSGHGVEGARNGRAARGELYFILIQKDPAKGSAIWSLFNSADIRHLSFSADVF